MKEKSLTIEPLSDLDIIELTNHRCVITEKDYSLRYNPIMPITGGLFDEKIFGYSKESNLKYRLAYYLLCSPIIYPTKLKPLIRWLRSNLPQIPLDMNNDNVILKFLIFNYYEVKECNEDIAELTKDGKYFKLNLRYIENEEAVIDNLDYSFLGLFGLLNISSYYSVSGKSLYELSKFINLNLVVNNPIDRPTTIFKKDNKRSIPMLHETTQNYKIVIDLNNKIEEKLYSDDTSVFEKCLLMLTLNDIVKSLVESFNLIGKVSKERTVRTLLSTRIQKSGRTTIVGDPYLQLDEVVIPKSLVYNTLKSDIIRMIEDNHLGIIGKVEYNNVSDLAVKYFNVLLDGLVAIINRNPSLHKYNMLAFKVKVSDDYVMKLPLLVTKVFGADFDGDTMSFYLLVNKDMQEKAMNTMSPQSLWVYEKYNSYLFTPRHEILYGLTLLTRMVETDDVILYNSIEQLRLDVKKGIIYENQKVLLNNKETCLGREKVIDLLGFDVFHNVLDDDFISIKNIHMFMSVLDLFDNRIYLITELQKMALEAATVLSNSALGTDSLYDIQNNIKGSNNVEEQIKKVMCPEFKKVMESNDRLKFNSLVDIVVKTDENPNNTLLEGMSEDYYINHSVNNRVLLNVKQTLVPTSGYITRQLAGAGINILFKDSSNNSFSTVVINKDWLKNNRTIVSYVNDTDIEIISPVFNGTRNVYNNEIDNDRFGYSNDHPIGLSLMTSLTEELTQSALSLKHGGKLYFEEKIRIISNEEDSVVDIKSNLLLLNSGGYFIIPAGFECLPIGSTISTGDSVVWGTIRNYVDYKLEGFKSLVDLNASGLMNKDYKSFCYSNQDGIITYDIKKQRFEGRNVDGLILINDKVMGVYNKKLIYFYKNGAIIRKYDRISSGIIDLECYNKVATMQDTFYVFCKQYYELFGNKVNLELLEILFKLIYKNSFSVKKALKNKKELLDSLAFGVVKNSIDEFLDEEDNQYEYSLINEALLCDS